MDFMNESMRSDLVIEYAERFYNSSEHDGPGSCRGLSLMRGLSRSTASR